MRSYLSGIKFVCFLFVWDLPGLMIKRLGFICICICKAALFSPLYSLVPTLLLKRSKLVLGGKTQSYWHMLNRVVGLRTLQVTRKQVVFADTIVLNANHDFRWNRGWYNKCIHWKMHRLKFVNARFGSVMDCNWNSWAFIRLSEGAACFSSPRTWAGLW